MNRYELIDTARGALNAAEGCANTNNHEHYAEHMSTLLDLLVEQLVGGPPGPTKPANARWNPESVLEEIAIAIKHRTISALNRWNIVYYYNRITCVPSSVDVPDKIILGNFTDRMVDRGFTTAEWNQIKTNAVKFYKELHS